MVVAVEIRMCHLVKVTILPKTITMSLLRYEFTDAPTTSVNGRIGQLVKDVRHYYSYAPAEEFSKAMPQLKSQEQELNKANAEIGFPAINYIENIMAELQKESELEDNLMQDMEYSSNAIVSALLNQTISLDMFSYSFRFSEAVPWLTFEGYADQRDADSVSIVVKEVFKSICYKMGVIFIDLS